MYILTSSILPNNNTLNILFSVKNTPYNKPCYIIYQSLYPYLNMDSIIKLNLGNFFLIVFCISFIYSFYCFHYHKIIYKTIK